MLANSEWRCQRERILRSRNASVACQYGLQLDFIGQALPIENSYIESFTPASKDWLEIRKFSFFS
jgi:hypothetical protein